MHDSPNVLWRAVAQHCGLTLNQREQALVMNLKLLRLWGDWEKGFISLAGQIVNLPEAGFSFERGRRRRGG